MMKYVNMCIGFMAAIVISGCVHMVSYYDSLSYKNLTDLKAETRVFFESCQNTVAHGDESLATINALVLSSTKAYEYEKGKDLNDDTISQLEIIGKNIREVKSRYAKNKFSGQSCKNNDNGEAADASTGCLTTGYCTAKWKVLEEAFDIAISTEQSKLRDSK